MSTESDLRQFRVDQANRVIAAFGAHGHRLLYSHEYERLARFDVDAHEQVWFIDHHTGMKIYPSESNMPSIPELAQALIGYIRTGKKLDQDWTIFGSTLTNYDDVATAAVRMDLGQCHAVQFK